LPSAGALVALLAAASAQAATTKTVTVGGAAPAGAPARTEAIAFIRRNIRVHVGDSVAFRIIGFHTVTYLPRGKPRPAVILPDPTHPITGANDAALKPFWFNGQPRLVLNPEVALRAGGKAVTGARFLNSGISGKPTTYRLRFTRTGTFKFVCLVHRGMEGSVKVVGRRGYVPSRTRDAVVARRERATLVHRAKAEAKGATAAGLVGVGRTGPGFSIERMFPERRVIQAGETLTFTMVEQNRSEAHVVMFGPEQTRKALRGNLITPVQDPATGGPPALVFAALVGYPSDPPPTVPPYDGSNHGDGFFNSGPLDNDPGSPTVPAQITITFPKVGTYTYECVLHPGMVGTVVVRQ
jgi:plastocyanin